MSDPEPVLREPAPLDSTLQVLRALGSEGTLGDVVALLGASRDDVQERLDALVDASEAHVRVTESGERMYRAARRGPRIPSASTPSSRFDRKTLHLIRARQGVISIAELVEHTGTSVTEAEREMQRLASAYGGQAHVSLDGHVVYAFPLIMTSVSGGSRLREPRPAWARLGDPMGSRRMTEGRSWLGRCAYRLGLLSLARRLVRRLRALRFLRLRDRAVIRRLALGHVFETALAGKGVISVETTRRYLQARTGGLAPGRGRTETVLRRLAGEFGAPVTREGGELFFGFRNVKRQFLAAEIVRRRLRLGEVVSGETVFDTGDSARAAAGRDAVRFDRELGDAAGPIGSRHAVASSARK